MQAEKNTVEKNTVVSVAYQMYDSDGKLLDKTEENEPMVYLHGGYDGIFPLVEAALHGKQVGYEVDMVLQADDAFGEYEDALRRVEDKSSFPAEVDVGMMFEADDPETGEVLVFRVVNKEGGKIVVDANHPLAGQAIRFVAVVKSLRAATKEEITHRHAHGPHGHQHH